MPARIYRPARNAMQSGKARTKAWLLDFDPEMRRSKEPLMGWTSSGDMKQQVRLFFDTREEAIAYMMANAGMTEADAVVEVERYLVMPGQALAYKVGMLKILELRARAKAALGDKFELRDFHHAVLGNGPMPLAVLERVIDDFVARKKAG